MYSERSKMSESYCAKSNFDNLREKLNQNLGNKNYVEEKLFDNPMDSRVVG